MSLAPKIVEIRVRKLDLPFKMVFSHALASRERMDSVLVRATLSDGSTGFGESTPRSYVTGETSKSTLAGVRTAADRLVGTSVSSVDDIERSLEAWNDQPAVRCALEIALLDALGHSKDQSVLSMLGASSRGSVEYSGTISSGTPDTARKFAAMCAKFGFRQVKMKFVADHQTNLELIKVVRSVLAEDVELRGDANGAWKLDEARIYIPELADAGVAIFEEPLTPGALDEYRELHRHLGGKVTIVVDESVSSPGAANWFIANGGADRLLLKVSKQGGIGSTIRLANRAREAGMGVHLGCHVGESSLLSAAGRVVAAHVELEALEGSYGPHLLERDVCDHSIGFGDRGFAEVDVQSPGLGVSVLAGLFD